MMRTFEVILAIGSIKAIANLFYFFRTIFLHTCGTCTKLPSNKKINGKKNLFLSKAKVIKGQRERKRPSQRKRDLKRPWFLY